VIVTCQRVESIASTLIRPMNWAAVDHGHANGRNRRYLAVGAQTGEDPFSIPLLSFGAELNVLRVASRCHLKACADLF
jgi:hypothetical protein